MMNQILVQNLYRRNIEIENNRESDIKTALVIQGGGMRGVYSMGALKTIESLGLSCAFDHVYGSSAGAINGAYFLAEQAKIAVNVYLDDISNKNFVNILRLNKIFDIDFLIDQILKKRKILDTKRVLDSKTHFHIILTDARSGEPVEFTNKDKDQFDMMEVLRATAALPILYNDIVHIKGRGYIDGGVREAVPLMRAIQIGCTDIVVILTRNPNFRRRRPNLFLRIIERMFLNKHSQAIRNLILSDDIHFNNTMKFIENPIFSGRIVCVYPSNPSKMVNGITHNRKTLFECAIMGQNDMRFALGV